MSGPSSMEGKFALVTGAASGLGRASALALAGAGADLCLVDIDPAGLQAAAAALRDTGRKTVTHAADLAVPDNCAQAVAAALEAFGALDALCNIAGLMMFRNTPEMTVAEWDKIIAVNLSAPLHLCRAAIPALLARDGAIVNVTSSAAHLGEAYLAAYCASKGGLLQLTRALAMEYVHKPLRINALSPGGMMTNIAHDMKLPEGADPALIKRFSGLRGLVEVEDAARVIAYLASPAARGFHGACLNMDRGITAG